MRIWIIVAGFAICFFVVYILWKESKTCYGKLSQKVNRRKEQLGVYFERERYVKELNGLRVECNAINDLVKKVERKNWWKIKRFHYEECKKIQEDLLAGIKKIKKIKKRLTRSRIYENDQYKYEDHLEEFFEYHNNMRLCIKRLYCFVFKLIALYLILVVIITGLVNMNNIRKLILPSLWILAVYVVLKILDGIMGEFVIILDIIMEYDLEILLCAQAIAIFIAVCQIIVCSFKHFSYAGDLIQKSGFFSILAIFTIFIMVRVFYGISDINDLKLKIRQLDKVIDENIESEMENQIRLTNDHLEEEMSIIRDNLQDIKKKINLRLDNPRSIAMVYWDYRFLNELLRIQVTKDNNLVADRITSIVDLLDKYANKMKKVGEN